MSGIGCHAMVIWMGRNTMTPTQMGGEGLNWTGIAPFTATPHIFQNLGDGTYFHSGLLAIRGAVSAGVNITYKILYNDAVAMTGGQPVEGHLSPAQIARQVLAEGAERVALVSVEPSKYSGDAILPREVRVHHRDELLTVEREFRQIPGTTVIIFEQTCAAEARRRRKRHEFPDPPRRVFINEAVCEGCGDCSVQSNCLSVTPVETEFGRKRRIDQSSCNKDYSCLKGHCPSFVTIHGGAPRRRAGATVDPGLFAGLPEPVLPAIAGSYDVLIPGIGGTGVVTVGALLGMAAHLEGRGVSIYDMTGLAQKGGAVFSHVRLTAHPGEPVAARIGAGQAKVILGCDLVVAAGKDTLGTVAAGQTAAVVNGALVPTAAFQQQPDVDFQQPAMLTALRRAVGDARCHVFDATSASQHLLGNTIGANMMLVGYAWQLGLLPIGLEAIERAIELNGVQVDFNRQALRLGRVAAAAPERLEPLLGNRGVAAPLGLADLVADRERILTAYQDAAYARRYRALVDRVAAEERTRAPGRSGLAEAAAKYYFKLLAYKDEYEVARLYSSDAFKRRLQEEFEGDYRVAVNLAPPLFARADPKTGLTPKRQYGTWVFGLFRVLRGMRRLRGTPFDIFGRSAERTLERQLIVDYERLMDDVTDALNQANHATAVLLAELPDRIRGYGHVKQGTVEAARKLQAELLGQLRAPAAGARAA
jgi:indolepyruvate ferredoxin oxidoreductase